MNKNLFLFINRTIRWLKAQNETESFVGICPSRDEIKLTEN
jgi:hypothetical protein